MNCKHLTLDAKVKSISSVSSLLPKLASGDLPISTLQLTAFKEVRQRSRQSVGGEALDEVVFGLLTN